MVFFGEMALRRSVSEFLIHYYPLSRKRNHQGIDNRLIESGDKVNCTTDEDRVPRATRRHAAVLPPSRGLISLDTLHRVLSCLTAGVMHSPAIAVRPALDHRRRRVGLHSHNIGLG
jgi:hypothetical protein